MTRMHIRNSLLGFIFSKCDLLWSVALDHVHIAVLFFTKEIMSFQVLESCVLVCQNGCSCAHDITDVTRCIRPSTNERCITHRTLAKLKYRE